MCVHKSWTSEGPVRGGFTRSRLSWDVIAASWGRRGMETVAPAMTWRPRLFWTAVHSKCCFYCVSLLWLHSRFPCGSPPRSDRWLPHAGDGWSSAGGVPAGEPGPVTLLNAFAGQDAAQAVPGQEPPQRRPEPRLPHGQFRRSCLVACISPGGTGSVLFPSSLGTWTRLCCWWPRWTMCRAATGTPRACVPEWAWRSWPRRTSQHTISACWPRPSPLKVPGTTEEPFHSDVEFDFFASLRAV